MGRLGSWRWWLVGGGMVFVGVAIWLMIPGQNVFVGLFNPQTPAWFTASQAEQGRIVAAHKCNACHGRNLEGKIGPQLIGPRFMTRWTGKDAQELERFIQTRMPLTRPGSLKLEESLAVTAFILQGNGYPAGEQELGPEALAQIYLEAQTKPDASPPGY